MLDLAQLYFQPQVTADGRQCVGAEALLRARGLDGRITGPKAILLMAESEADEDALDWWVIESACTAVRRWPGKTVSVNISTRQFRKPQFAARLLRSLPEWQVDPQALELELLEDGVIEDFDRATETMGILRQAGVRIALDDFGTGLSSLSYLRRLPIDKLKIDKSLIVDIADIKSAAIVQAITAM
ncbi:MAG: EAL domain-containing protein, partial [Beijerinckiaceae bacterium]